jgi:hypothetical protein
VSTISPIAAGGDESADSAAIPADDHAIATLAAMEHDSRFISQPKWSYVIRGAAWAHRHYRRLANDP